MQMTLKVAVNQLVKDDFQMPIKIFWDIKWKSSLNIYALLNLQITVFLFKRF
jgi:hypothetical protein